MPTNRIPPLTKITAPQSSAPVLRPRLFQRLDDLRSSSLVWLVGPPGSGKSTLASTYLSRQPGAHLWYQLDADDANVATFFHYFRVAVQRLAPCGGQRLPAFSPEYLPGLSAFVRRYAEIIGTQIRKPAILVLDNYEQLPNEAPLHGVIRDLASFLPPEIGIFVLSRSEPPPAFSRLRLHGHLVILEGAELDLTFDEAETVAATRAAATEKHLEAERVARAYQETRGWFAGFTLLLVDPRSTAARGLGQNQTRQVLFDYFATELFEQLPAATQIGLLHTALLPTMTLAQISQLCSDSSIGMALADLQRRNCFVVQRGEAEPIYEYHALFRAFLLNRATVCIPPDEWRGLQRKAAGLLADANQSDAAAPLYREAEDWPGLTALVLHEAPGLISAGRHQTLEQWLRWLPADSFRAHPWLHYWRGMARLPFDPAEARGHFESAYRGFGVEQIVEGLYSAWAGIMDSFFFEWQDLRPADRWITEFEELRARHPVFPSRAVELRTYWAMGTLLHRQPQHPFVPAWGERAEVLLNSTDRELSVLLGGYLIIWHLWRGDSAKALSLIQRLDPWTQGPEFPPLVSILWSCAMGLYHSVRGDVDACLPIVEQGLALGQKTGLQCWDFLLCAQAARCNLVAGDVSAADPWISRMAAAIRTHSPISAGFLEHLRCNAAAQRGDWFRAVEHGRKGLAMALESGVPFLEAHCRIDLARTLIAQGDQAEWPEQLRLAHAIGHAMDSKVLRYLCLDTEARAAFESGAEVSGWAILAQALALSREMGEPTWLMEGPQASAFLYERALAAGIETGHVRDLIRRRGLTPADPTSAPDLWPWPVRIHMLGRFEIFSNDQPLRSSRKAQHKPLELIKVLCAFGGHAIHRDRVTDALWPDAAGDAADQALGTALHRLRKLLQHEQAIQLEDRQLSLDFRYVWVDALVFDRISHHPGKTDRRSLEYALNRYRGHFLPGESAPWALAFRERLRGHFLKMSERLGALLEQEGGWPAAVDCYLRAIEIEPVAESFYRRLMTCHAQLGQRAEALAVFQRCRQALLTHLGVSPTRETQGIYQQLLES